MCWLPYRPPAGVTLPPNGGVGAGHGAQLRAAGRAGAGGKRQVPHACQYRCMLSALLPPCAQQAVRWVLRIHKWKARTSLVKRLGCWLPCVACVRRSPLPWSRVRSYHTRAPGYRCMAALSILQAIRGYYLLPYAYGYLRFALGTASSHSLVSKAAVATFNMPDTPTFHTTHRCETSLHMLNKLYVRLSPIVWSLCEQMAAPTLRWGVWPLRWKRRQPLRQTVALRSFWARRRRTYMKAWPI